MGLRRLALGDFFRFTVFAFFFLSLDRHESLAGSLRLSWTDNSTNESGFGIERKIGSDGDFALLDIVGAEVASYTDSGLVDGITYCYRLFAFNTSETSPYSNESCALAVSPGHIVTPNITSNIPGGAVLGGASLIWTATPSGVPDQVQFWIDGVHYWTEYSYPYQFNGDPAGTLNPTLLSNGSHQLMVRALYGDNSTAEQTITVTVLNGATQQFALTVLKSGSGTGTVTSSPAGIDCGGGCSGDFSSGTNVTLTARPASGSVLSGWSGTGCSTGSFTLTANMDCTATFTLVPQTISMNISNGAVLSGRSVVWTAAASGFPVRVQFRIDGVRYWTDYSYPYQFNGDPSGTLDTTILSDGVHELKVRAVYADNSIAEATVTLTVSNRATQPLALKIGVFRPSTGEWFLDLDGNGRFDSCGIDFCITGYGNSASLPVVGDWFGTGKSYIGVFDSGTKAWHLDDGDGQWGLCGSSGDICVDPFSSWGEYPVVKDLGSTDKIVIGVFQAQSTSQNTGSWRYGKQGVWKFDSDGNGASDPCWIDECVTDFGALGDLPITGDWNRSGDQAIGIFRPQSGEWYLDFNGNGVWDGSDADKWLGPFGSPGDLPVVGDWDGIGTFRIGVFRPSTGEWFLDLNGNGGFDSCAIDACLGPFGNPGDLPVAGSW